MSFSIGRLGELKKIIDCNVSQLLDEQPTDSGHNRHVTDTGHNKITDTGQSQLRVQQEQTENKIIKKIEKNVELDNSRYINFFSFDFPLVQSGFPPDYI